MHGVEFITQSTLLFGTQMFRNMGLGYYLS